MIDEDAIVTLHYTLTLKKSGTIFDSTRHKDPLIAKMGEGKLPPGFEDAMMGMDVGQMKRIELAPNKLFGEPDESLVSVIPLNLVPDHITPEVGQRISITDENGKTAMVSVAKIEDGKVTLDANPPQVGQPMILSLEIVDIDYV